MKSVGWRKNLKQSSKKEKGLKKTFGKMYNHQYDNSIFVKEDDTGPADQKNRENT